jgi:branched-chain amino acid transport system permease protein
MLNSERTKLYLPWMILIAVMILLPIVIPSPYIKSVMILVALYGVLAIGMGMLMGQAGVFSLAHPTWFGLGAYATGILSARGIVPTWVTIIIGAIFVALICYIIGALILRLRGFYLACATFAILMITEITLANFPDITGGHEGLVGIPALSIGGYIFRTDTHYYFLSWTLCIACLWFGFNIINSRVGRAIRSFRDSEVASQCMGVNIPKYRLQIFILTAVMASLAGSIFCFYLHFAMPGSFSFQLLVLLLIMVVIGGTSSVYGPLVGSFIILWLRELIHMYLGKYLPVFTGEVDAVFFGILIMLVLIFMPQGLVGWIHELFSLGKRTYEHFKRPVA